GLLLPAGGVGQRVRGVVRGRHEHSVEQVVDRVVVLLQQAHLRPVDQHVVVGGLVRGLRVVQDVDQRQAGQQLLGGRRRVFLVRCVRGQHLARVHVREDPGDGRRLGRGGTVRQRSRVVDGLRRGRGRLRLRRRRDAGGGGPHRGREEAGEEGSQSGARRAPA